MPTNKLNIVFTAPQLTAITGALTTADTNFPFAVNLSLSERKSLGNIDNERFPFVQRTMDIYAPGNATLVSGFAGTLADAQNDYSLYKQIQTLIPVAEKFLEKLRDTQQLAASELYDFFLEFYGTAQRAAVGNVPGADAVVDDLKTLFEKQGNPGQPPTP